VPLPLASLRVVELGSLIAGPFAGRLLADYGADGAGQERGRARRRRAAARLRDGADAGRRPFAPGATGNLATEDLVYMLDGMGYETGVSLPALLQASAFIESKLGKPLPSRVYRASAK
jgi:hypothetical protein